MSQYFAAVFAVGFVAAAAVFVSYDGGRGLGARGAIAVVLLLAIAEPIAAFVSELPSISPPDFSEWQGAGDYEYETTAREAFCEGVRELLCDKYSFEKECFSVKAEGFDFSKMRAEKIIVTLYGRAVLVDPLSLEKFINEYELGVCYAKIGI